MNKKILLFLIAFIPLFIFAQSGPPIPETPEIFNMVETMPEYPGGQGKLIKFIQQNVQYPDSARDENIKGKVYVSFVVDTAGKVGNINIIRGVHTLLDDEAIRVIKLMPKWKPGTQKGKPVKVRYNLPISFRLE